MRSDPGDGSKAGGGRQLDGVGPLDLRALGLLDEGGGVDLAGLLGRLLLAEDAGGKTRAQLVVEGWITDAVGGNPRAVEDILDRTEKGRQSRTSSPAAIPPIDAGTASKILEVLCGAGDVEANP